MRLIDADKLPYVGDETYLHEFDYCYRYAIDAEPTVDAIPVEWIENYLRNYRYMAPIEKNFVREMIKAWEEREEE